jgi:hypothetical protein
VARAAEKAALWAERPEKLPLFNLLLAKLVQLAPGWHQWLYLLFLSYNSFYAIKHLRFINRYFAGGRGGWLLVRPAA